VDDQSRLAILQQDLLTLGLDPYAIRIEERDLDWDMYDRPVDQEEERQDILLQHHIAALVSLAEGAACSGFIDGSALDKLRDAGLRLRLQEIMDDMDHSAPVDH
jgi:hypothetical protein